MEKIKFTVNGRKIQVSGDNTQSLLDYLREEMGLLGVKNGCSEGHCGTCTVIVDGKAKRSCLLPVNKLRGSKIETIESLHQEGKLHPLQVAFIETGAVQCGFCTPGMIMAAKALLDKNSSPTEDEIKKALKFNLCRCTGYQKIFAAVKLAARYLREGREFTEEEIYEREKVTGPLGEAVVKNDVIAKVKGEPVYVDDLNRPDMLIGALHLSSEPHAEIVDINTEKAEEIPGVVRVLTAEDIPGRKDFGLITVHQPVLAYDRVRYVGDPVALVLAENRETARQGVEAIEVEYNKLPTYFEPQEALNDEAINIHEEGNKLIEYNIRKGDLEHGFEEADVIVEGEYSTPFIEHGYLEPEGSLAEPTEEGVNVYCPSQSSHKFQDMIAATLDLPQDKVRVILTRTGGAFGGREEPTVQIQSALGAYLTKRPVKIVLNRRESIRMSYKRHAAYMKYKTGATADGRLVAGKVEIYSNTGAYASAGKPVAQRLTAFALGPYEIPHVQVDTYSVYTNCLPAGAMRGFGGTEVNFAAEVHLDRMARELNMDPMELRLRNALTENRATITGHLLTGGVGFKQCLQAVKTRLKKLDINPAAGKKLGIGISGGYKNVGIGAGRPENIRVAMELNKDGEFDIFVGCVDSGQGIDTALAQVAAEVMGCFYGDFNVISGDTKLTSDAGVTTASRMVYRGGNAVSRCARILKNKLLAAVAEIHQLEKEELVIREGKIFHKNGNQVTGIDRLAREVSPLRAEYYYETPETDPLNEEQLPAYPQDPNKNRLHYAYDFGAQAAIVEIDEKTNKFKVLKVIAAHDVGKAINPSNIEGQIEGAVVMGLGYALSEEFRVDEEGWPIQDNLAKLRLPRATDAPEIDSIFVEDFQPDGPFGAKGMGELPISLVAPAICNALYDGTGIEINHLPVKKQLEK